jgi:hypothetical protein
MTENSSQLCAVYKHGHIFSKAPNNQSSSSPTMPTYVTIEILGKLVHKLLAISPNESNITFFWNTNLGLLIVLMPSLINPTIIPVTRTMKML